MSPPEPRTTEGRADLGICFLGCGAATRMHSRTLRKLDADVRRYFASRSPDRAESFSGDLDGAGFFGSYDAALAAGEVDVALVATPPSSHLELTRRALRAGKDVIVEKPAFLRVEDFDVVARLRAETGRRVMVAENYFYKPLAIRLRKLLAREAVGRPLFVSVNAVKRQEAGGWRDEPGLSGGGALFEGGIHWVNFVAHLGLEVRRVHGFRAGGAAEGGGGPERSMQVCLEFADGAVGVLLYSWEVPSPLKGLRISRIYGTEGAIAFESNGLFLSVWGRRKRLLFPGLRDISGYRAMFRDFLVSLRTGREPAMTLAMARRDVEIVQAAYRAAGVLEPEG